VNPALASGAAAEHSQLRFAPADREHDMQKNSGKKKEKCKNCEGKGLIKNGDKKMKCQRCGGTGFKP
jgi:DnaJ-class molecular chaperone